MGENRPLISQVKLAMGLAMKLHATLEKRLGYNFRDSDTFLQVSTKWLAINCFEWFFTIHLDANAVNAKG